MSKKRNPRPSSENGLTHPVASVRILGSGRMADAIRAHDWSTTPLGPLDTWTPILLGSINTILSCGFPMLIFWGPDKLQFFNDSFLALIGEKRLNILGKPAQAGWRSLWHIIAPHVDAAFEGKPSNHENVPIPIQSHGKENEVYWSYSFSPIYESASIIPGVVVVCRDATREVLATRERDALAEQLNQILDATTDAVLSIDRNWKLTYLNRRAKEVLAPVEQGMGSNIWDTFECIVYPGSPFVDNLHRSMDEQVITDFEAYYPHPLNLWLYVHAKPTTTGIVVSCRDITARKAAETTARNNTARLDAIYNTSLEYIGLLSTDGFLLDCNRASLEFAGNTREELIGHPYWDCPWFTSTPGAPEMLRHAIARAAAGEYIRYEVELFRPEPETEPITFDFSLAPVRDANNKVIFLVPEARDITWTKRAEAALKESEKLAAVGRLAASIAHEINNPLEAVTNLLYLAINTQNADEQRTYLRVAEQELRRVSIISSQTLRFHRQSASPRIVPPEELIEGALSIFQGRILSSGVHLEERLRAKIPIICFDGEIRQVLNNLISNAIDAMQSEGGRLLVRTRNATSWTTGAHGVVFTIADTGTGISPENLNRIFDAFFTTKGIAGTGLGLWVSHEIVLRHQGILHVRSSRKPNHSGTVFTLFLPINGVAQSAAA